MPSMLIIPLRGQVPLHCMIAGTLTHAELMAWYMKYGEILRAGNSFLSIIRRGIRLIWRGEPQAGSYGRF